MVLVEDVSMHVPQEVEAVNAAILGCMGHCCSTDVVRSVDTGSTSLDERLSR